MLPNIVNVFEPMPDNWDDARLMRLRCDSQSMHFYADISHYLVRQLTQFETLSVLDVGARTGAGSALLRLLHHPWAYTRLKFDPVVALDVDPEIVRFVQNEFKDIHAICDDIKNVSERAYDVVVCSHTIEHVDDLQGFLKQLERVARRCVVLACPINEELPLSEGHIRVITPAMLEEHGYSDIQVFESFHFHNGLCGLAIKFI